MGDDWLAVHEWASTDVACRYQPWGPNTERETREFVDQAVASWLVQPQERFVWIAERSGMVVGLGELKLRSRRWGQADISYAVDTRHWGQGLGTAIATELLTHAFQSLDLHRVAGTCDPRNLASDAVLRRIGMTYEGRMRHTIRLRDGWRDSNLYSMLSDEWLDGKHAARPAAQRGHAPPAGEAGP